MPNVPWHICYAYLRGNSWNLAWDERCNHVLSLCKGHQYIFVSIIIFPSSSFSTTYQTGVVKSPLVIYILSDEHGYADETPPPVPIAKSPANAHQSAGKLWSKTTTTWDGKGAP